MCRDEAPKTFEATPDGRSVATSDPTDPEAVILDAAGVCPVGAIIVRDLATDEQLYP